MRSSSREAILPAHANDLTSVVRPQILRHANRSVSHNKWKSSNVELGAIEFAEHLSASPRFSGCRESHLRAHLQLHQPPVAGPIQSISRHAASRRKGILANPNAPATAVVRADRQDVIRTGRWYATNVHIDDFSQRSTGVFAHEEDEVLPDNREARVDGDADGIVETCGGAGAISRLRVGVASDRHD